MCVRAGHSIMQVFVHVQVFVKQETVCREKHCCSFITVSTINICDQLSFSCDHASRFLPRRGRLISLKTYFLTHRVV